MMAIAVMVCTFLLLREARLLGFQPEIIVDLVFWVVLVGIAGARLFFVFLNFSYFVRHPLEIIMIHHGGLAWQGSLISGTLFGLGYIRRKKLPLRPVLDLLSPYIALGQAIGRIGCFLNGCCYGREIPWGIYFPVHEARLHPTQLYSAAGLFLIFLILKKFRAWSKKPGQVFVLYLVLASSLRFIVEFFRADHEAVFFGLSVFQSVSLLVLLIGLFYGIRLQLRSK
ncbi:MAG: prolipoprotein diacylglyceryl transferase [Candidatus Omnitrophota bacterium]